MMVFRILCGEWIEPLWDCMRAEKNAVSVSCQLHIVAFRCIFHVITSIIIIVVVVVVVMLLSLSLLLLYTKISTSGYVPHC